MDFGKRTWAEINLGNAEHNFRVIRKAINPGTKLCCVIKADAYGHGAVETARLYEELGADFFAVSNIEEAMQLRRAKIETPILILGFTPPEDARILADNGISQCVYGLEYAKMLSENLAGTGKHVKIHIKIDTGMGRIGFVCRGEENMISEAAEACSLEGLEPEGIFTHFASADDGGRGKYFTLSQYEHFSSAIDELSKRGIDFAIRHCCNSAGIFDYPDFALDMVRAGVVLYGLMPSDSLVAIPDLKPVMKLCSVVSNIKTVSKGESVGYGRKFTAERETRVATVPIGYADGFLRSNSCGNGLVEVAGVLCPVIGNVCMDQIMVDISGVGHEVKLFDTVTIFGDDTIGADDVARRNDTIGYEIVCAISERVPRFYVRDGRVVSVEDRIVR